MEIKAVLDRITEVFKQHLQDNIVGIYLHGSLAMDCFHPSTSDIDLLVVVDEPLSFSTKQSIIRELVGLTPIYPVKGFEMSVILAKDASQPVYPMPFQLHYGQEWGKRFLQNPEDICQGGVDPDLSAHIVVTQERGVSLYGPEIPEVFAPVPAGHFMESILEDVKGAEDAILHDPVYTILNLCRTLAFVQEGKVASKKEGGEWGLQNLNYPTIIEAALEAYEKGDRIVPQKPEALKQFAKVVLNLILHKERTN